MNIPEEITKDNIEKLIEYLHLAHILNTEKDIELFRERINSLNDKDFNHFINELLHFNK